jgi:acyl-CoA reductase-like NAD-dependent aldehyde dehydrogenase
VVDDAIDENTDLGPLISPKEIDRIEDWVNADVASGAQLMTGGKRINAAHKPAALKHKLAQNDTYWL